MMVGLLNVVFMGVSDTTYKVTLFLFSSLRKLKEPFKRENSLSDGAHLKLEKKISVLSYIFRLKSHLQFPVAYCLLMA